MEVRRKRPPPPFSVEAASSRKVGSGGDGTSSTGGRYAANFFLCLRKLDFFLHVGRHQEDLGTAGNASPANPFLTSPARKSAKGTISRYSLFRVRSQRRCGR